MTNVPCCLPVSKKQIRRFAVAFGFRNHGHPPLVAHASIIYRDTEGELCIVELADTSGHVLTNELRDSTCDLVDAWVIPALSEAELLHLSKICEAYEDEWVRFGFNYEQGELTCASFVISIFWKIRFQLIDASTWEISEADKRLQELLWERRCQELKKSGMRPSVLGKGYLEFFNRYRPEDVFGACLAGVEKVSFQQARDNAEVLTSWMQSIESSHNMSK
ncbi:MAG: hypothetical protein JNL58_04350 [Planctomyces sp.]|nr:hypothetical protein [Planctomyces sp.]